MDELDVVAFEDFITIRELVERICALTSVEFDDFVEVVADRPGKDQAYYLRTDKIEDELGWKNTISLDEGLKRTLDWVDEGLDEIRELPLEYIHKP